MGKKQPDTVVLKPRRFPSNLEQITNKESSSMPDGSRCPFCNIEPERVLYEDTYSYAIRDGFPVSDGHILIIPKRHIDSFFDVTREERTALLNTLARMKTELDTEFQPDAYNIGINDGSAAGQTIPHLHIHLIPRYRGDAADPRGGVRWIFPDKANYWDRGK